MRIIFEFAGGPMDGKTVIGRLGEQDEADRYYALTHHGRVHQRFRVASSFAIEMLANEEFKDERPHHFQQHSYRVTDRLEGEDEVLVRVEYVGKTETKSATGPAWESSDTSTQPVQSIETLIEKFSVETAQAMGRSYSHYWPPADKAGRDAAMHLSHALLSRDFSVFMDADVSETAEGTIDLLGVAPSQDWFAACQFRFLSDIQQVPQMMDDVEQLEHFWLHRRLTSDFAQQHTERLARHCQCGVASICYLYRSTTADDADSLLQFWRGPDRSYGAASRLIAKLQALDAQWLEPRLVRRFEPQIAFYLLGLHFPIHRETTKR